MARFIYNGEPDFGGSPTAPAFKISVPMKDGASQALVPLSGPHFIVGDDLGYDITDIWSLVIMRGDSRYTEV